MTHWERDASYFYYKAAREIPDWIYNALFFETKKYNLAYLNVGGQRPGPGGPALNPPLSPSHPF